LPIVITLLLSGIGYAADKVVLTCSGISWAKGQTAAQLPLPSHSLVVDSDNSIVTGIFGQLSISKSSESEISLEGVDKEGDLVHGSIDRYTGSTVVSTYRNKEIVGIYNRTVALFIEVLVLVVD
jgi:hypothetical protein